MTYFNDKEIIHIENSFEYVIGKEWRNFFFNLSEILQKS